MTNLFKQTDGVKDCRSWRVVAFVLPGDGKGLSIDLSGAVPYQQKTVQYLKKTTSVCTTCENNTLF